MTKENINKIEKALVFFGIDNVGYDMFGEPNGDFYTLEDAKAIAKHTDLDWVDVMTYLNDRGRDIINYYRVEKYEAKIDKWFDYCTLPEEDVKALIKGYKKDLDKTCCYIGDVDSLEEMEGVYTRKNTLNMYTVVYEYGVER